MPYDIRRDYEGATWAEDWPCSTAQHQVTRLDLTFGTATKTLRQQSLLGPSSGWVHIHGHEGRRDGGHVDAICCLWKSISQSMCHAG